jgi:hypothetical protein
MENTQSDDNFLIQLYGKNPASATSQAIISLNKASQIIDYKWYLGKDGYPYTYIKGAKVPLHRYIWYLNSGKYYNDKLYVDHVNRNKLDATDKNLRLATPAENSYNKTSKNDMIDPVTNQPLHHIKLKKSGYSVSITKDKINNKIDKIASLEEAKEIYNAMATEMFDKFAVLY